MGGSLSGEVIVVGERGRNSAYNALMCKYGLPVLAVGGAEGDTSITQHLEGRYDKTKESYIRDIARVITDLGFGKGKVDVNDSDYHHLAQTLLEVIPGPKSKTKFRDDAALHEKVCQAIAKQLNDKFTPSAKSNDEKLINMDWKPEQICFRVAELVDAIATGMHSEFLGIWGQVRQNLKNMVMLKEMLEKIVGELAGKCQDAVVLDSDKSGSRVEPLNLMSQQAKRMIAELGTQIALIQGLLDTAIDPAEKDIAKMLQDDSPQWKLAKRLGMIPGSADFSPALAGITRRNCFDCSSCR